MDDFEFQPWHGLGILIAAILILSIFYSTREPKQLPPELAQVRINTPWEAQVAVWNGLYGALGGVALEAADAAREIAKYRERIGSIVPPMPSPVVVGQPTSPAVQPPTITSGEPPAEVQSEPTIIPTMVPAPPAPVIRSYPPEMYASSAEFVDARFTGFEQMHLGLFFNEGKGKQCVAGVKYYMLSALGLPIVRDDGGLIAFAPSQSDPGYPNVALADFRLRHGWENTPPAQRDPNPPSHSIAPPQGVATIDGRQIEYHIEIVDDVNALQRGDIVILGIHTGMFSAFTENGSLMLFDQNGGGKFENYGYHTFPRGNFDGALRVVYHL